MPAPVGPPCPHCGRPTALTASEKVKRHRKKRASEGFCGRCTVRPAVPGSNYCDDPKCTPKAQQDRAAKKVPQTP